MRAQNSFPVDEMLLKLESYLKFFFSSKRSWICFAAQLFLPLTTFSAAERNTTASMDGQEEEQQKKPVHFIVLDAGPLIANTPSISTLLKKSEEIFTTPSVIAEIKDATARARLETLVMPFITLRTPKIDSMKFVTEFARKSGDLPVLSKTDLEVIALAYELECERNGGDWRLRKVPGQKTVNGAPPSRSQAVKDTEGQEDGQLATDGSVGASTKEDVLEQPIQENLPSDATVSASTQAIENLSVSDSQTGQVSSGSGESEGALPADIGSLSIPEKTQSSTNPTLKPHASDENVVSQDSSLTPTLGKSSENTNPSPTDLSPESGLISDEEDEDDGGGEWITPSNITRHKTSIEPSSPNQSKQPRQLQVATLTADHALQNTLLLINLNLLSSSLSRISHIKAHILRCHACFTTTKQMDKQFCPRCGQAALTRVTTTTTANGKSILHLKRNMQWNTRGDRYSIPKPVAGSANGKMREKGGGKGGWGKGLILAEDQKEYVRAVQDREREKRKGVRDLLDRDFLPGIMGASGGDRGNIPGHRIQIGAGRNANSKKR